MEVLVTSPVNEAEGQALETVISVTFDEVADRDSVINSGAFVVTTSASKLVVEGPGLEDFTVDADTDYLTSDTFTGVVQGTITSDDNTTFRFTPTRPLEPNATYTILLGTKITTRTIGAVTPGVGNVGTGSLTLTGPYDGDDDTFTITIIDTGALGLATFKYRRESTGLDSELITTDREVELEDGIFAVFLAGTYEEDDTFDFDVYEAIALEDIYTFSFITGSASYVEPSEDPASFQIVQREVDGFRRIDNIPSVDSGTLAIVSISPEDGDSNVRLSLEGITITFNKELDPASLTDAVIQVLMENLPLDETEQLSIPLTITPTISGNVLTLRFTG